MDRDTSPLERVGRTVGYGAVGLAGAAAVALAGSLLLRPAGAVVYDLLYLPLGPSEATETALLVPVLPSGVAALVGPALAASTLRDRAVDVRAVAVGAGAVLVAPAAFLLAALVGLGGLPVAVVLAGSTAVGALLVLRVRRGLGAGGVAAASRSWWCCSPSPASESAGGGATS